MILNICFRGLNHAKSIVAQKLVDLRPFNIRYGHFFQYRGDQLIETAIQRMSLKSGQTTKKGMEVILKYRLIKPVYSTCGFPAGIAPENDGSACSFVDF